MQHCIRASLPYKNRTKLQKNTEKRHRKITQIETGERSEC